MHKSISGLIYILLICIGQLYAQEQAQFPVRIENVVIYGNEKTREEVIVREIPFQFPDTLELADFQLIQNRITNLFLFNRVELAVIGEPGHHTLLIQVTEFLYIYPVPLLFINERDWDKISYGFQLTHVNFRGMHEQINVGGWLGYNPAFFTRYHNPWMGKRSRLIFGFSFFGKKVGNKFFDFDESHLGGRITIGKRLGLHNTVEITLGLRRVELPEKFMEYSVSGDGTDIVPKFSLQYRNDHRDLVEYPRKGYFIRWRVTRAGIKDNQPQFWRWDFDHRLYLKISKRFSIGGRNLLRLNRGELPIYDRIFIGFADRIRGYFDRVLTANNLMLHNYEIRISLVPIKYATWKDAPFLASFFQNLKYGLSLGIFMDSGVAWNRKEELTLENHFTGFGAGLHFHLPYIYLLRIDHAWNDRGDREWIVEALVSF